MKRAFEVLLNDDLVGFLVESEEQVISFHFDKEYLNMAGRPILGQAFEDNLQKNYTGKTYGVLPAFFANLIPEAGKLRHLIEAQLSEKDDLSVLAFLGLDLPGAIVIKQIDTASKERFEEISFGRGQTDSDIEEEISVRFSLAGIQLKFSVSQSNDRFTIPASGRGGDWIVKIDSREYPSLVENEFVIMRWAKAVGFDVPDCLIEPPAILSEELQKFVPEHSNVFLIRRYDRKENRRIHQEDFAQVVSAVPKAKYEHITYEKLARLIYENVGESGYYEFVRRLTFIIASGNTDAHLKNWSLIYPDGQTAQLSPLYDQVSTIAWGMKELALKFASSKFIRQIDEAAFIRLAERAKLDKHKTMDTVHECLSKIYDEWVNLSVKELLPESHLKALSNHWAHVPILKKFSLS